MDQTADRRPRWKKNPLLTCGIGCGAFVIVVAVALTGLYFWAVSPGPQIPTERVLGPESLAYLRIDHLSHDEGFQSLTADILLAMQEEQIERSREELPAALAWLNRFQRSSPQEVVADLKRDLPTDITVTVESPPGAQEPAFAAAVNLSRYPRLIRLFFTWIAEDFANRIREEFPGAGLEFVENTAVWAQTPEVMTVVMDRAKGSVSARGASTEILRLLQTGSERWDIHAAAENREGLMLHLQQWLGKLPEDFPLQFPAETAVLLPSARTVQLGTDIVSRELIRIELEVEADSQGYAERWDALLHDLVDQNRPDPENPIKVSSEIVRSGSHVVLRLGLREVKAAVLQAFNRFQQREKESESEPKQPEKAP